MDKRIQDYDPRLKRSKARMQLFEWSATKDWYRVHDNELNGKAPSVLAVVEYLNENRTLRQDQQNQKDVFEFAKVNGTKALRKKLINSIDRQNQDLLSKRENKELKMTLDVLDGSHRTSINHTPFHKTIDFFVSQDIDFEFKKYGVFNVDGKSKIAWNDEFDKVMKQDNSRLLIKAKKKDLEFMNELVKRTSDL